MKNQPECNPKGEGMTQADIFRYCGFDWGDKNTAPSTQQQYWVAALLQQLMFDGAVTRDMRTRRWRLV